MYSRAPAATQLDLSGLPALRAEVSLGDRTVTVFNVHTLPPRTADYVTVWNEMMAAIVELIRRERGPVLLAGDLNLMSQHRWYRELLALGLRDAHEQRGRAWISTWPNGRMPYPSLRLDHFFATPGLEPPDVREVRAGAPTIAPLSATSRSDRGSEQARTCGTAPGFAQLASPASLQSAPASTTK